jgi:DNA-binding transcriptional MocR family regulator
MVVVVLGGRGLVLIDEITAELTFPQPKIPAKTTLELKNPVLIASISKSVDPQVQDNTP